MSECPGSPDPGDDPAHPPVGSRCPGAGKNGAGDRPEIVLPQPGGVLDGFRRDRLRRLGAAGLGPRQEGQHPRQAKDIPRPLAEPSGLKPFVVAGIGVVFGAELVEKLLGPGIELQHQRLGVAGQGRDPLQALEGTFIEPAPPLVDRLVRRSFGPREKEARCHPVIVVAADLAEAVRLDAAYDRRSKPRNVDGWPVLPVDGRSWPADHRSSQNGRSLPPE